MYSEEPEPVRLTPEQCWTRLHGASVGRIGLLVKGTIEILPINYRSVEGTIFLETSSATILAAANAGEEVAFEADGNDDWIAWSVLAHGKAAIADDGPPTGWEIHTLYPAPISTHIHIVPTRLDGRLSDIQDKSSAARTAGLRDPA